MSDLMITEGDVDSFRHKLAAWGATLTDAEQAILQMVSVRAFPDGPATPDVEGFMQDFRIAKKYEAASPVLAVAFGPGTIEQFVGMSVKVAAMPGPPSDQPL